MKRTLREMSSHTANTAAVSTVPAKLRTGLASLAQPRERGRKCLIESLRVVVVVAVYGHVVL